MRHFSEIFLIILLLTALSGSLSAQLLFQGERKYLDLHYEDLSTSSWARATDFGERMKRLARQALPPVRGCHIAIITLAEEGAPQVFEAKLEKRRFVRITIPRDYRRIEPDTRSITDLMSWLLLANAGFGPEHADKIRDSWYVTGLARKALSEMSLISSPFSGYYPAAYLFESDGIAPTLRQLTSVPLLAGDSAPRLIYEEYSELLIQLCSKNRLFREGILEQIIKKTLDNPESDGCRLFAEAAGEAILKRNTGILRQDAKGAERELELEKWFRRELERLLIWDLLPASVRKIEAEYHKAVRFRYTYEGSTLTGTLADFVLQWEKMDNPGKLLSSVMDRLLALGQIIPPDLAVPLSEVRSSLSRLRTDRSGESLQKLRQAEASFFTELERHIAIERFLIETEKRVLPPATRYFITLQVLKQQEAQGASPASGINALLNAGISGGGNP